MDNTKYATILNNYERLTERGRKHNIEWARSVRDQVASYLREFAEEVNGARGNRHPVLRVDVDNEIHQVLLVVPGGPTAHWVCDPDLKRKYQAGCGPTSISFNRLTNGQVTVRCLPPTLRFGDGRHAQGDVEVLGTFAPEALERDKVRELAGRFLEYALKTHWARDSNSTAIGF